MAQHVTVTEYNPGWQGAFRREARRIKQILGDNCVAVYHIGSTAVSGLAAKPVTDIMPVVKSLAAADCAAEAFVRLGYEYLGEFGIAGRRYLRKGGDERTHQVHIFCADDEHNIFRHLAFRDYLRANAEVREEYGALKRSLAQKYPYDIQSYCDGKEEFVKRHEALALASFDSSWDRLYLAARKIQAVFCCAQNSGRTYPVAVHRCGRSGRRAYDGERQHLFGCMYRYRLFTRDVRRAGGNCFDDIRGRKPYFKDCGGYARRQRGYAVRRLPRVYDAALCRSG